VFDAEDVPTADSEFPSDYVCFDATTMGKGGHNEPDSGTDISNPRLVVGPQTVLRRPNRVLVVVVLMGEDPPDKVVIPQVTLTGDKGTYIPETMNGSSGAAAQKSAGPQQQNLLSKEYRFDAGLAFDGGGGAGHDTSTPWVVPAHKLFRFAPRTPGDATLSVSFVVKDEKANTDSRGNRDQAQIDSAQDGPKPKNGTPKGGQSSGTSDAVQFTYEYMVPQEYSGAMRLGISGVISPFDHAYVIRKAPDAAFGSIVDNGVSPFDGELALGFAWFAFNRDDGGRIYVGQDSKTHWGLYTGLGLVSGSTTGVTWLRSLYLGLEYEFAPNSSVAFAGMIRRVNRLGAGLAVGDPVSDGTTLTTTGYAPAFGLVLNFTPDFLKFATSLGSPK
jgi:hypothetical protein